MVVHVLILDKKQNSNNNLKNKDGKCFQYAAPFALNYEKKFSGIQKEFQTLNQL